MKQISIIIPIYKAHDTITNTLHSVFMQRYMEYTCYLIVDGEEVGSYDYLKEHFPVEIHYMKVNAGPGVARQYGIDHSKEPFISFIDADDTYLSSLALHYQHLPFEKEEYAMVSTDFLQENRDISIRLRERDMVWMHGKMYRRAFLDKYDIRFNETRANEDVGFQTQCQCYANEQEQIFLSKDQTYMWQWRDDSTVRTDNLSYAYNESIEGLVQNKIYAFKRVLARQPLDAGSRFFILSGLAYLFKKYLLAMIKMPKQLRHVKKWSKVYYKTLYPLLEQEYIDKAEKSIVAQMGFDKVEEYEEFIKWKALLNAPPKKRKRKKK